MRHNLTLRIKLHHEQRARQCIDDDPILLTRATGVCFLTKVMGTLDRFGDPRLIHHVHDGSARLRLHGWLRRRRRRRSTEDNRAPF